MKAQSSTIGGNAEAGNAGRLARVAARIGALDDRLKRGPEGWRHRLALIEAADLSWFVGDRIGPDRLALWISMRLSGVQDDTAALARVGWLRDPRFADADAADVARFLPVEIVAEANTPVAISAAANHIEIEVAGGHRMRISPNGQSADKGQALPDFAALAL